MRKALVTGGAGFLGSHLVKRLLDEGYYVLAIDNLYTGSENNIAQFKSNPNFSFQKSDVCQLRSSDFSHGAFDEIYNLACPASPIHYQRSPTVTTKTSLYGIVFCLDLALRDGAKFLHCSTSEIYGDPLVHPQPEKYWGNVNTLGIRACYDEGKRVAETLLADYVREFDVDARMVRIFNTYGPYMHPNDGRVISNFIMQALRNEDITLYGDGSQTRSFQYCDDLIEAFRRFMLIEKDEVRSFFRSKHLGAPVLNTGNPAEYTIRDLATKVLQLIPQSKSRIITCPLPGDDPKKRKPDITLAEELLNWRPSIPLEEGLLKTIDYFKGCMHA